MPRSPPRLRSTAISPSRTPARPCRPRAGSPAGRCSCDRLDVFSRRAPYGGLLGKLLAAVRRSSASRSTSGHRTTRCSAGRRARCPAVTGRAGSTGSAAAPTAGAAGSPGAGGFSRRPRPAAARTDRADALHGARLPLRQQRVRLCAPPQRLDPQRPPRPGGLGGRQPGHRRGRARRVRAAVLHAVVRERHALVLQVPRDPVAPTGPPRGRGLHHALPAAWAGPHRLPRAGPQPRLELHTPPAPPRPADDHRSATGGELGDQAGQRRRGGLAARSSPGAMAGADRG